MAFARIVYRR